jgi:potassium-dependent mechanosensitive channel
MTHTSPPYFTTSVLAVGFAFLITVSAQVAGPTKGLREAPLTVELVEKKLEQTKADPALNDAAKAEVTPLLEAAIDSLGAANDFQTEAARLKEIAAQGPAEIAQLQASLAARRNGEKAASGNESDELPAAATADMINTRLNSEKARLTELNRKITEWDAQLATFEERPLANHDRVVELTRLLTEAQQKFSRWNGESAGTAKEKAQLVADQAAIRALRAEMSMLEQESLAFDINRDLTEARRALTASDLALVRENVALLESRSGALVNARIGEAERLLIELGIGTIAEDPLLKSLVKETRDLTSKNQEILTRIATADQRLKEAETSLEVLQRDKDSIRAQIEIGGLGGEFSEKILEMRESLPKLKTYRSAANERHEQVSQARLDAFRIDHELDELAPTQEQLDTLLTSIRTGNVAAESLAKIEPILKNLVETRFQLRRDALEGNRKLAQTIGAIDLVENNTIAVATELRDYLGEKLIWVASSPPIGANAFTGMRTSLLQLLGPDAMKQYLAAILRINLPKWMFAVLLACLLLLPRRRLRRYLAESAARTRRISQDGIGNTLGALAATFWLALPTPTLLAFFGWVFATDVDGTAATYALGKGLSAPAVLLLVFRFTAILCWQGGVAEAHFRWKRITLDACHRALMTAIFFYLPAHMLLAIWFNGSNLTSFQGPGRLVFIVAMISICLILNRFFRGRKGILQHMEPSRSWVMKLRKVWTSILILLPIALAILAAIGHYLTSVVLAYQIQNTAFVVFGGTLVYGLLTRWVGIRERRITLQNAMAARDARRQSHRDETAAEPNAEVVNRMKEESFIPAEDDEAINWGVVGEQTRHLIKAIVTLTVVFGCWLVWSEIIPVLKYLDARNVIGQISVSDLIWLGIISLITTIVFQNLPGLLEVTFLQALELESGVRNAIITICQYVIIAIGIAVAIQTVGIDMANFGWIAAALSVGLGFGLQEVVANFVSGLILLFERPIRVGDIVTVAGVDGVVTKIRIRATTITNWDKKEFIVPNKEFVTGTLMNWTLSNPMTRLVFPVGIAYGSDIRQAQDILLDIARSQPEVLTDPEPVAIFELFGDSALNFSLRLFLPHPELRLEMTHRINTLIHDRFVAAGIQIPYPQRDLHLRSIDPSIRIGNTPAATMPGE